MFNRAAMKQQAQQINKSAKVNVYGFSLLFLVITLALTALDTLVTGGEVQELMDYYQTLGIELPPLPTLPLPATAAAFVGIAATLLSRVLQCGYYTYHLGIYHRRRMDLITLFDGFIFVGKIILLGLVENLFITLWSLLFVFPGFIAIYRYRFAFYNLCSDPEMGVMEALRLSCQQTRGCKWSLFVLDLSFLGWGLLSVLTAGILNIWLLPYRIQTDICCYHAISEAKQIPVPGEDIFRASEDTPDF